MKLGKKSRKRIFQLLLVVFFVLNILSYVGAYSLTHFSTPNNWVLGLPRPNSSKLPTDIGLRYVTQRIPISPNEWLETWLIPAENSVSNGTVLLFPGNGGSKAKQLLAPTQVFHNLGYDALLVDFRGVGGSSGNTTTLGVREAKDVTLAMKYAQSSNFKHPFVLYGVSMGSVAILKAVAHQKVNPDAVILEAPFARLVNAVKSRIRAVKFPTFPLTELMVFWGGVQHGFNGFAHNPVTYASSVKCPALILHGKLDKWTTVAEIDEIFKNLQDFKKLVIFPDVGHNLLVTVDKKRWKKSVEKFLKRV
ncbi:MAG: alpha/beta hydrolase [Cyanobacteria bacterium P01_A01_bin.45]